jgi:hypothetical protein
LSGSVSSIIYVILVLKIWPWIELIVLLGLKCEITVGKKNVYSGLCDGQEK